MNHRDPTTEELIEQRRRLAERGIAIGPSIPIASAGRRIATGAPTRIHHHEEPPMTLPLNARRQRAAERAMMLRSAEYSAPPHAKPYAAARHRGAQAHVRLLSAAAEGFVDPADITNAERRIVSALTKVEAEITSTEGDEAKALAAVDDLDAAVAALLAVADRDTITGDLKQLAKELRAAVELWNVEEAAALVLAIREAIAGNSTTPEEVAERLRAARPPLSAREFAMCTELKLAPATYARQRAAMLSHSTSKADRDRGTQLQAWADRRAGVGRAVTVRDMDTGASVRTTLTARDFAIAADMRIAPEQAAAARITNERRRAGRR